jgi:hypothetical protein
MFGVRRSMFASVLAYEHEHEQEQESLICLPSRSLGEGWWFVIPSSFCHSCFVIFSCLISDR